MKKMKWILLVVLVFVLSVQPVMADGLSTKAVTTEETNEVAVSGNTMSTEATDFYYSGEVYFNNLWTKDLKDIYGVPVSLVGEPGIVKVVLCGLPMTDNQTITSIRYLEQQLGGKGKVKIVCVDADGNAMIHMQPYINPLEFSLTQVTSTENEDFWDYISLILAACDCPDNAGIILPPVYVLNSDNKICYVSSSYYGEDLAPLVNYVKGMDEYTGKSQITAFVNRLYQYALGRNADAAGLNNWVSQLMNQQISGTDAAFGFFFSDEMTNRNLSDAEFVKLLYKVMFDRIPQNSEVAYWTNLMKNGVSRLGVYKGFADSAEFGKVCSSFGIVKGTPSVSEGRDMNYGATLFVSRLYTQALGRQYDVNGLNDWCNRIATGSWSATDVSTTGFFNSPEFLNKNLNNTEYVKVLYRTFLDREYDQAGLNDWVGKLNSGAMTRDEVLKGFSYSREFRNIMAEYGL